MKMKIRGTLNCRDDRQTNMLTGVAVGSVNLLVQWQEYVCCQKAIATQNHAEPVGGGNDSFVSLTFFPYHFVQAS